MPEAGVVEWSIVDLQGRVVWSASHSLDAGFRTLDWNGATLAGTRAAPGVYFARVRAPFAAATRTTRFLYLR
jgi:hypothetical protein